MDESILRLLPFFWVIGFVWSLFVIRKQEARIIVKVLFSVTALGIGWVFVVVSWFPIEY